MRKYLCLAIVSIVLLVGSVSAAEKKLVVTGIESEDNGRVAIVLNGILKISGIEISRNGGQRQAKLVYPYYRSKNGATIAQAQILAQETEHAIAQAVSEKRISGEKLIDFDYKIGRITLFSKKSEALKAFAEVVFNNVLKVQVRIMQSDRGLWVAWPGNKLSSGSWKKQVEILDYEVKERLEHSIIARYETVVSEEP